MNALREDELLRPNVDVPTIVPRMLGALPALRTLRGEVTTRLPGHDLALFDGLETFILALAHAQALTLGDSERPTGDLVALNAEASALREDLIADARNLARHKLVDAGRLDEIKGLSGYRNVSFELLALSAILRQSWATISGKTPISLESLDRAERLAQQMIELLAARERQEGVSDAAKLRQRAFTLFYRAHNQTRRAVIYLRWDEEDADSFCPPLFAPRRGKKAEEEEPAEAEAPAAPAAAATPATPATPAAATKPGMPGSNPFGG